MSKPRALVTGGAGFLGSHLCDALLGEGYSVVSVDNLLTGRRSNFEHLRSDTRFEFQQLDINQPFDCGKVDYVFHFACPASPVDYTKHGIETLQVGSLGTFHALDVARKYGAKYLISSTSECYGDPLEHPQSETYWGNVNPVGPRSCYDESKRFAESLTMAYHRTYGLRTNIARIFNTYGPRMKLDDGRVVPAFIGQALRGEAVTIFGDGSQTRSFCYVSDLVDGIYRLMQSDEHYPVNLGNPNENVIGILQVVVIGLLFCLMIRRTGTLWFALGFHAAWDWAETFFYGTPDSGLLGVGRYLNTSVQGPKWLTGGSAGPEGSVIAFLVLLLCALLVHLRFPNAVYPDRPA